MSENTTPDTTPRCECGYWITEDGKTTGCVGPTSSSKKRFLPGHDAKLKSLMIQAKHRNQWVSDGRGTSGTATEMAARFGFSAMVANATPRVKAIKPAPVAEVVAQAEEQEVKANEAEAIAKVRAVRPRRSRKVVSA